MELEAQISVVVNLMPKAAAAEELRAVLGNVPLKITGTGNLMCVWLERHCPRDVAAIVEFSDRSARFGNMYLDVGHAQTGLPILKPQYDWLLKGEWPVPDCSMRDFSEKPGAEDWMGQPFHWLVFITVIGFEQLREQRIEIVALREELDGVRSGEGSFYPEDLQPTK